MPDVHAKLSASGSAKWLNCPGSVKLEEEFPDRSSPEANEGTLAHALGELYINRELGDITQLQFTRRRGKLLKKNGLDEISDDMEDYISDYCGYVMEVYGEHRAAASDVTIVVEKRLDFSGYVPEGFGTGDCVIVSPGRLDIIDLKYGKGVLVPAEGNTQLRLYALGAFGEYDWIYGIEEVGYTIYQPRLDNISTEVITAAELLDWGRNVVKPKAAKALEDDAECVCGQWCDSHFCRARAVCRAYNAERQRLAEYDFKVPAKLSKEEISDVLEQAPKISKWAELVKEWALNQAIHGVKFPGYKLVEGRSVRVITDKAAAEEALIKNGYKESEIIKRDLRGITELEKLLGGKSFKSILGAFVDKPAGKPCLVPMTDKRPEMGSVEAARADFEDAEEIPLF